MSQLGHWSILERWPCPNSDGINFGPPIYQPRMELFIFLLLVDFLAVRLKSNGYDEPITAEEELATPQKKKRS